MCAAWIPPTQPTSMLRLTALVTIMIVIGCHAVPHGTQEHGKQRRAMLDAHLDKLKSQVDVVKTQGTCWSTFMCTKNGGAGGTSKCPWTSNAPPHPD